VVGFVSMRIILTWIKLAENARVMKELTRKIPYRNKLGVTKVFGGEEKDC